MTIEQDIATWAATRPPWQQAVLRQLADGHSYTHDETVAIAARLRAGQQPPPVALKASNIPGAQAAGATVQLRSIRDTRNVNALIDAQVLTFAPTGLTVVYGDNASGKSGYARLIKAVARARHREPVHADVFDTAAVQPQQAVIAFTVGGVDNSASWPDAVSGELRAVSFYDEACGDAYIGGDSELTYRPSALTMLDGLIAICDAVRAVLDDDLRNNDLAFGALPAVVEGTSAAVLLRSLSGTTTKVELDSACEVPDEAEEQLGKLLQEEARLRASNPAKERSRLEALADKIETVARHVGKLAAALGDEKVKQARDLRDGAVELRAAATLASSRSFEAEPLPGVGTAAWRALWEAARAYSQQEAYREREFPVISDGAHCVLCQQEVRPDASDRLGRFEAFIKDTTAQQAAAAERELEDAMASYRTLDSTPSEVTACLVELSAGDAPLGQTVADWLEAAAARCAALVDQLGTTGEVTLPALDQSPHEALDGRVDELRTRASAIDATRFDEAFAQVVSSKNELESRLALAKHRSAVAAEIARLAEREAIEAAKRLTETGTITRKTTELTEAHVTALVRDRFTRESDRLQLERIELKKTGGQKGKLRHRPSLLGAKVAKPVEQVLSEGEQTALGLAGYFTEAHFDDSKSALVLDDPVTSLDHRRRAHVARRLAELASDRQVIVFTHDVAFVGDLRRAADEKPVDLTARGVERRGDNVPGVCTDHHPWKAKDVSRRLGDLDAELARIKRDRAGWDQVEYEKECADWAGKLSETWERIVNLEVVSMVVDAGTSEVKPRMFKVLARITDQDDREFQQSYGRISAWVRRHDKSPSANYVAPEPTELEQELTTVRAWFDRVKKYRN